MSLEATPRERSKISSTQSRVLRSSGHRRFLEFPRVVSSAPVAGRRVGNEEIADHSLVGFILGLRRLARALLSLVGGETTASSERGIREIRPFLVARPSPLPHCSSAISSFTIEFI